MDAKSFDQPLNFHTKRVTDMSQMFDGCTSFDQPLNFDTKSVTNMMGMFYGCRSFNQQLDFDTKSVTEISYMFSGCTSFNWGNSSEQILNQMVELSDILLDDIMNIVVDLGQWVWDLSKCKNAIKMFEDCTALNRDMSNWKIKAGCKVDDMYKGATNMSQKHKVVVPIIPEIN